MTIKAARVSGRWYVQPGMARIPFRSVPPIGHVYILQSYLARDVYKIGQSGLHTIQNRMSSLKVGSKTLITATFTLFRYKEWEQRLHKALAHYRLPQSEWFCLTADFLELFIKEVRSADLSGLCDPCFERQGRGAFFRMISKDADPHEVARRMDMCPGHAFRWMEIIDDEDDL